MEGGTMPTIVYERRCTSWGHKFIETRVILSQRERRQKYLARLIRRDGLRRLAAPLVVMAQAKKLDAAEALWVDTPPCPRHCGGSLENTILTWDQVDQKGARYCKNNSKSNGWKKHRRTQYNPKKK